MKQLLVFTLSALFITACASIPLEGLHTEIDPDSWEVGFQKDFGTGNGYIREFIPKGGSINDWSKLVSIEFLEGEKRTLSEYVHAFQQKRQEQCPGTEFEILSKEEYTITYQASFPDCMGHKMQSEITRIYMGMDGLHRLSYAEKTATLDENTVNKWQYEFSKSYIVKGLNKERVH
ncbi:hypothetical protein ACJJID_09400 [Microbulbifer sp. CnH-101-G]|uniref:hypothetical protein n=1 Tax=Microbulbifer sp. CnH-101-G TaxID=3243393 RepID=UPI0040395E10